MDAPGSPTGRVRERMVAALLFLGLAALLGGWTTYSTFSATTSNDGNRFTGGTVSLVGGAAHTPLYDVADQVPGARIERCVEISYTGSLPADLRLYGSNVGPAGAYLDLVITSGQGGTALPGCAGFSADTGSPVFSGTLQQFAASHRTWSSGRQLAAPGAGGWRTGDAKTFRFVVEQRSDTVAQGLSTGAHTFTWEARSR